MSNLDEFSETSNQPKKHSRVRAEIKRCWSQALFGYDQPEFAHGFFNNPIYKLIATPLKFPEILFRFLYSALTALIGGTSIAAKIVLSPLLLIGRLIMMITSPLRSVFGPIFKMLTPVMNTKNPVKKCLLVILVISLVAFNAYIISAALTFSLLSVGIIPLASVTTVGGVFTMALTPTYLAVTSFFATLMPLLAAPAVGVIVALAGFAITALIAQKLCQYIVNLATHTYQGQGVKAGLGFVVSSLGKLIGEEEGLVKKLPEEMNTHIIDLAREVVKTKKTTVNIVISQGDGDTKANTTVLYRISLTEDGSKVSFLPIQNPGDAVRCPTYTIEGLNTDNPVITTTEHPPTSQEPESAGNLHPPEAEVPLPQARWTLDQLVTQCLNLSNTMGSISLSANQVPEGLSPGFYSLNHDSDFTDASKNQYELCYKTDDEVYIGNDGSKIKIAKQADEAYQTVAEDEAAANNNLNSPT